ncbi:MAG: energy transducer TonB [Candidatus Kapaibacterium sp.]
MITSTRYEQSNNLNIKIPWDNNTAKGFGIALVFTMLFISVSPFFKIEKSAPRNIKINTIPVQLLNFGDGDGTGISKGNLAKEGRAHKGKTPSSDLADAEVAGATKVSREPVSSDELADNMIPKQELSSNEKHDRNITGRDKRNTGTPDGSASGRGLGDEGSGPGKGMGLGEIEWGGGGNRTVLYKKVPKFPDGVSRSAKIKIRFTVLADGTVAQMVPLQKADPRLEKAAMEALKQWRFNRLENGETMVGIIPMTFRLR